jgi:transposase
MERRQYTREFKLEVVRLIKERGVSYAQASADLGVHPTQLRNWVKQLANDPQHAFPRQGQMKPEQLEIARSRNLNSYSLSEWVTAVVVEMCLQQKAAPFRGEWPVIGTWRTNGISVILKWLAALPLCVIAHDKIT